MNEALHWRRYSYLKTSEGRFRNAYSRGSALANCRAFWLAGLASIIRQARAVIEPLSKLRPEVHRSS